MGEIDFKQIRNNVTIYNEIILIAQCLAIVTE